MRSYRKQRGLDAKNGGRLRRAIARQATLPTEDIRPADLARLEAAARRQLDRNRQMLSRPERQRYEW